MRRSYLNKLGIGCLILAVAAMSFMAACAKPAPAPAPAPAPKPAPAPTPTPAPAPAPAPAPKVEPITLKAITSFETTHQDYKDWQRFEELVKTMSNGQLIINRLGANAVIPRNEQAMAVSQNVVQLAWVYGATYDALVKGISMVTMLSQLTPEQEIQRGVVDIWQQAHKKVGLYLLGRAQVSPGHFVVATTVKVERPSNFTGLKLGGETSYGPFYTALGGTLVKMSAPDYYSALQQGLVRGILRTMGGWVEFSIWEVAKYFVDHPVFTGQTMAIMNLDTWNKLPPNLQKVLTDAITEARSQSIPYLAGIKKQAKQTLINKGMTPLTFSPEDLKVWENAAYGATWQEFLKTGGDFAQACYKLMQP